MLRLGQLNITTGERVIRRQLFHAGGAYVCMCKLPSSGHLCDVCFLDASRSLDRWYLKQQQQAAAARVAAARVAAALRTVVCARVGLASWFCLSRLWKKAADMTTQQHHG